MTGQPSRPPTGRDVYDVVGIGLGPANLSLACAVDEWNDGPGASAPLRAVFLERMPGFSWHSELLLPGTKCQVAFVKDLATTRDPRSRYTFLNYLHQHDRLHEFFDLADVVPSREEFSDYFAWAARALGPMVRYGQTVTSVEPERSPADSDSDTDSDTDADTDAVPRLFRVRTRDRDGHTHALSCRGAVLAVGGEPVVPPGIDLAPGGRVFHSDTFLSGLRRHCPDTSAAYSIVVVGSGQSAADMIGHLIRNYPNATVTMVTRSFSFRAVDANPFVNEFFLPATIDFIYGLPAEARGQLNDEFYGTGYGIVDSETLLELHRLLYAERLRGRDRLTVLPLAELVGVREDTATAEVELRRRHVTGTTTRHADAVVLATGYLRTTQTEMLRPLLDLVKRDDLGEIVTNRDYSAVGLPHGSARLFIQGFAARTHGIGDEALSNVATRAATILAALTGDR